MLIIALTALFLFVLNLTGHVSMLPGCMVEHYTGFRCLACGTTTASIDFFNGGFDSSINDHIKPTFAALAFCILLTFDIYSFTKGNLKNPTP